MSPEVLQRCGSARKSEKIAPYLLPDGNAGDILHDEVRVHCGMEYVEDLGDGRMVQGQR